MKTYMNPSHGKQSDGPKILQIGVTTTKLLPHKFLSVYFAQHFKNALYQKF